MKTLILIFALSIFSMTLFAQIQLIDKNVPQPKFALKTHPLTNFWGNFKLGLEYAYNEKI